MLGLIQDLNVGVHAIEAGQRGYLLTGEDAYLQPYDTAVARIALIQEQLFEEISETTPGSSDACIRSSQCCKASSRNWPRLRATLPLAR